MPTPDKNRPTIRAKGFQKPTSDPHPSPKGAPAPAAFPKPVDFTPPAVIQFNPIAEAPEPQPSDASFDDSPVTFIESNPIPPSNPTPTTVASTHSNQQDQPSAYQPDQDPIRVSRRQWWKHNLYVKSGREAADNPQQPA